ncbi:hypothetical protein GCM10009760_27550 [Kitasatospora kazusensis]|uniref:Uncharacterized protein n=1 Tax=Kitasatospora kazusensis TaxID=407974 RepID=A0ABP5L6A5_9ACTN
MGDFSVGRWRRHGHDRLYVNREGADKAVGWYDFKTGEITVKDEQCRAAVLEALASHLPTTEARTEFSTSSSDDGVGRPPVLAQSDLSLNWA